MAGNLKDRSGCSHQQAVGMWPPQNLNINDLPTEIHHCILDFADLPSLKSIRLTSKFWAILGREYLVSPDFLCQTYRDDFAKLLSISNHAAFSPLIKSIRFDQGELHEYHARHNIYFIQYMKEPEERERESRLTWDYYLSLKQARETFDACNCNLAILTAAFRNLDNLAHINISLNRCPFKDPLLERIWRISSSRLLPRVTTTEHFANILLAVSATNKPLASLAHDRLPFEFWGSNLRVLGQVTPAFAKLTDLRLCCDYSIFPNALHYDESFTGLATCLMQATELRTLHLGFQASQRPMMDFETYLGTMTWKNLHTLSLGGMNLSASDAGDFIVRHRPSLSYLEIGGPYALADHSVEFRVGTLKSLLTRLRDDMCLEKVNLRGLIQQDSGEPSNITWLFGSGAYDDEWEYSLIDGSANGSKTVRKMEDFVVAGGEWPQEEAANGPADWPHVQAVLPGGVEVS